MANANSVLIRSTKNYKTPSASNLAHDCGLKVATYWLDKNPDLAQSQNIDSYAKVNEVWNQWLNESKELYSKKHQRQIRDDAVIIEEGLIVIGSDVEDRDNLDKLRLMTLSFIEKFEKDNNTKVLYWSIHNHEGKDEEHKNLHVHFFFSNVNNDGEMVRRNWKKSYMAQLQTDIYDASKPSFGSIERATNYQELGLKAPKNQHHRVFRTDAIINEAKESSQVQAKEEDLKKGITKLREEFKANGAERKDYALLEQLNRELKEQLKNKDLTIESLHQQINAQKQLIETLKSKNEALCEEIVKKDAIIDSTPNMDDYKEYAEKELKIKIEEDMTVPSFLKKLISTLKSAWTQIKELRKQVTMLKTENDELRRTMNQTVNEIQSDSPIYEYKKEIQKALDNAPDGSASSSRLRLVLDGKIDFTRIQADTPETIQIIDNAKADFEALEEKGLLTCTKGVYSFKDDQARSVLYHMNDASVQKIADEYNSITNNVDKRKNHNKQR